LSTAALLRLPAHAGSSGPHGDVVEMCAGPPPPSTDGIHVAALSLLFQLSSAVEPARAAAPASRRQRWCSTSMRSAAHARP